MDPRDAPTEAEFSRTAPDVNPTHQPGLQAGDQLQDYQLLEQLGAGAMGTVFRARHEPSNREVAIKVLEADVIRHEVALRRFRKEATLLAKADSPYITRLIEVNSADQVHFIVMELVDGLTVGELIKHRKKLDQETAIQIAFDVATGLGDIEPLGIIHRDIKPENILLTENSDGTFRAKLTDFGLARHTNQTQSMEMTRENAVLGTPRFMSPEQFSDASQLDARSDIYSLGVTLFYMLCGQAPFPDEDVLQLAESHRHVPAPDMRSIDGELSDPLSEVVRKCLQKRPDLRYQSAQELADDLARLQRGEAISISVHPLIPECDLNKVQSFRFEWTLASNPRELWPYVSNTERLNRAIGLPAVNYTTVVGADEVVEMFAEVRILGMAMKWREHVFEWIEERRMGVLREFESGPFKWFTSVVEFIPVVGGGTKLVHSFQVEGRGWFGRTFAKLKLGYETRRSLTQVYRRIDGVLAETKGADPLIDAFEKERALSRLQRQRLDQLVLEVQGDGVRREALLPISEFIRVAPAQEIARIRPLDFAREINLPFEDVMAVLLHGTKRGLFELVWDVICPSCRVASQSFDLLKMIGEHERCEGCNLTFDVDFRTQVEAVFRVHPQVREGDVAKYCIGGPAHSPHVVAQTRVAPGEKVNLGLALGTGTYTIRSKSLTYALEFQIRGDLTLSPESKSHTLHLDLGNADDWTRAKVVLGAGEQLVTLDNSCEREIVIRVERASAEVNALSAMKIMSLSLFRQLFPSESLGQSQLAALTSITLLTTRLEIGEACRSEIGEDEARQLTQTHLLRLSEHATQYGGTWIKIVGQGAMLAFVESEDAIRCAKSLAETIPAYALKHGCRVTSAIASGEVSVSMICGQLDYLGEPVEQVMSLLHGGKRGELNLPKANM